MGTKSPAAWATSEALRAPGPQPTGDRSAGALVDAKREIVSQKSKLAEAIRYALSRWEGLSRFLDDGRVELDSNVVERAIRPLALNRKNGLFAGSNAGGQQWAVLASLVKTCKLNAVEPQAYLADVLTRLVNSHANSRIDELLSWSYVA